ncbi:MAG: type II secretion system GspH family protein [Fusobacterium sp.]|nr:type II secretion system GspH family protein [Fusobacterium sp.]
MRKLFSKTSAAFTMAEILLSLTIIGVVAAITLPSLTGNINERTWATQKKALYARMSQAIPLLDSMNTYTDAESFIAGALNTVTKINNVCSQSNIEDCGINKESLGPLADGAVISFPDTWSALGIDKQFEYDSAAASSNASLAANVNNAMVAAFETGNGESIVLFYNPDCVPDQEQAPNTMTESDPLDMFNHVCINMIYDLNNNKGPNTVGKDIGFMTVFYPTDSNVVAPVPYVQSLAAGATCDSEYRLPNKFEAAALALNGKLIKSSGEDYLTSSKGATGTTTYTYIQKAMSSGELPMYAEEGSSVTDVASRCVKR